MPSNFVRTLASSHFTSFYGAVALAVFLGFAGPFGSFQSLAGPQRYAYWFGLVATGYVISIVTMRTLRATPPFNRLPKLAEAVVVGLVSTLPMMFVVAWTLDVVFGRSTPPSGLGWLYASVVSVQLVIAGIAVWPRAAATGPAPPGNDARSHPFFSRLPTRLGSDLLALQAQDHYLLVHTRRGSALIHMRFSEAVQLLPAQLGFQAHRSWWVARREVVGLRRDGQITFIELTGGLRVPVGRTYLAAVRAVLEAPGA